MSTDLCRSLSALLSAQARKRPEDVAVMCDNQQITFEELERSSTQIGSYLRSRGVAADAPVGLFMEPSADLVRGVWGIVRSGGAYLPLAPSYPDERLSYMLTDSGARLVLTTVPELGRVVDLAPSGVVVVALPDVLATDLVIATEEIGPRPTDLAYVIYTSGSTGTPKGVMIEHRSIASQMNWLGRAYQLEPGKIVLQKTPMSFDAAQWEILAPALGCTAVVGRPGIHRDPYGIIDTIKHHSVTTLQCVPTLLAALLDTERLAECESLTSIFSGGEALSRDLASRCLAEIPWAELVNLYGPTECTINASALTVDAMILDGSQSVSIGRPVDGVRFYLLDEHRRPVEPGQVGELCVSGVQLARGYLGRPELTAEKFVEDATVADPDHRRIYRTGDLARSNPDGTVEFLGRADNQIKLRGFRVELDEIRLGIEAHPWVRNAGVIVQRSARTDFQNLIAYVELNPNEAALMDQNNHGVHHQSKQSRLQVRAQLSNPGCRDAGQLAAKPVVDLPGRQATAAQRRQVFARKTYRFFDGAVGRRDILDLLAPAAPAAQGRDQPLHLAELGSLLRFFGQHLSEERLLPKYGYASPGALYAAQLYLELGDVPGLADGFYYYHPVDHQLVLIAHASSRAGHRLRVHLVGKRDAIEPVYRNNVDEVLEIEAGHMIGLFEAVLPGYGLGIRELPFDPAVLSRLDCAPNDLYLGTFELAPGAVLSEAAVDIYVQSHPGRVDDLTAGQYLYQDGELDRISNDLIRKKHVIAINQEVYERSCFGVTVVSREEYGWRAYLELGRTLHRLQSNGLNLGFMSSGYSSRTGNDLPTARQMTRILSETGRPVGPSYFFVGGRVSDEQVASEGMREDAVHMRGPAEMIKADLGGLLPDYMVPNQVIVLDRLPLTANGKVDLTALRERDVTLADRPLVPPGTAAELRVADLWRAALRCEEVSIDDDFFEAGGNSLIAVTLINRINRELGTMLPLQVLFETPTVRRLADRITHESIEVSRLARLRAGKQAPIFCWPGLGGYPMNLRTIAGRLGFDRPFYGVQAVGINDGEEPYGNIREMAAADVAAIREVQPHGPYTLWGYSFGARPAFEAAYQLERAGERVDHVFLIAPGSPRLSAGVSNGRRSAAFDDTAFVTILFSVFTGTVSGELLRECLRRTRDEASFVAFVVAEIEGLDADLVRRIVRVVRRTYRFEYTFEELRDRRVDAPVTIFKARGDDYSSIESRDRYSVQPPSVVSLSTGHYEVLRDGGVTELVRAIHRRLDIHPEETAMPHVTIKHFPVALTAARQQELLLALTKAVSTAFNCDEGVISIALESVDKDRWDEQVYQPEIVGRKHLLHKKPTY